MEEVPEAVGVGGVALKQEVGVDPLSKLPSEEVAGEAQNSVEESASVEAAVVVVVDGVRVQRSLSNIDMSTRSTTTTPMSNE
jgi:hypothetical protein